MKLEKYLKAEAIKKDIEELRRIKEEFLSYEDINVCQEKGKLGVWFSKKGFTFTFFNNSLAKKIKLIINSGILKILSGIDEEITKLQKEFEEL